MTPLAETHMASTPAWVNLANATAHTQAFLPPKRDQSSTESEWEEIIPLIRRELNRGNIPIQEVENLTQHVLLELIERRQPPSSLRGLAVYLARFRLKDWRRKRTREACRMEFSDGLDAHPVHPNSRDLAIDMMAAMDRMPARTRAVFLAQGIEHRTREETAVHLGMSSHEVRARYEKAIRIVAEILEIDNAE